MNVQCRSPTHTPDVLLCTLLHLAVCKSINKNRSLDYILNISAATTLYYLFLVKPSELRSFYRGSSAFIATVPFRQLYKL